MPRQLLNIPAPAKINLFLHITGRRDDGYHNLQTLFQFLDYGDSLDFEIVPNSRDIQLSPELYGIPAEQNLIVRAARLLQNAAEINSGAIIDLKKRLPMGGGLGGGSSDAATTLLALNRLWNTNLSLQELANLGLQLGADVPVFIAGYSAWAEGVGEQLQQINLPTPWYLVLIPSCEVSTAKVFNHPQLPRNSAAVTMQDYLQGNCLNDCEETVRGLYPQVDNAFIWAQQHGRVSMSGTGACLFCQFQSEHAARSALLTKPAGLDGFVAQGCNQSPTHQYLQTTYETL